MRTKLSLIFLSLLLLVLPACIDKFEPDLNGADSMLVIDGGIYDSDGPFTIALSYSTNVYTPKYQPISNASVKVLDDQGNTFLFTEAESGQYFSSGMSGIPGRSYKLLIVTPDGKHYESSSELLRSSSAIDNIRYQLEYHKDARYPYQLAGYQFYVSAKLNSDTNAWYMWRMVKTYEYHSEFLADAYYNGKIRPFPKPDSLQVCWKTEYVKSVITLNTKNLVNPDLTDFPLNYVNTEGRELSVRYSQLTEQLTVNADAIRYFKTIIEGSGNQSNLYTQQPFQILGNVVCADDPNEAVLGYFLVAGRSALRLFAAPPNVEFHYYVFVLDVEDYRNMRFIKYSSPSIWPIYLTTGDANSSALAWPAQECIDCRLRGGTLTKPDFWDQ